MELMFYINTISHGGAERVITNLATMLSERGHNCTLVTSFQTDWEYEIGSRVKRITIYEKPIRNFICRNIKLTRALRRVVLEQKPELLIAFMAQPNYRAVVSTIGTKTKTLLSVRNDPNKEYKTYIERWIAKFLYRSADAMVFQTEDARIWFPKCIQKKSRVIFNAVMTEFYQIELPKTRVGIVTTGRLSKQKNHSLLLKAYAEIASQIRDDLTIFGSGDATQLRELAKELGLVDRVHFPGQVRNVQNIIKHAKIYVMSSDYEGMPNALMEALALGLPCISTDCPCGGPRTLFTKSMQSYLTPVGDVKTLANTILQLIQNEEELERHGRNCKVAALAFMPEVITDQWESYLKEIIEL